MIALTLERSEQLVRAALREARRLGMNPMSVVAIDASANLKFALREDGAGASGIEIALGKARAALSFNCTSRQIADALAGNPLAGPSVLAVLQGRVVLLPGGVPVLDANGVIVGALAAAGDAPDRDEAIVIAAAGAAA